MIRNALLLLLIASFSFPIAGCGKGSAKPDDLLTGTWEDTGGASYTFAKVNGAAVVSGVVDSDGEVFVVNSSGWKDGAFTWVYTVPSTGYEVTHTIQNLGATEMTCKWSNQFDEGVEIFTKVE